MQIEGVSDVTAELLMQHGFKTVQEVAETEAAEVADVEGIGPERAYVIVAAAITRAAEQKVEEAAAAEAAAEAAAVAAAAAAEAEAAGLSAAEGDAAPAGDGLIDLPEEPQV
jgi:NAD-dependent DNA ligase